jgi:hypothetical protein
MALEGLTAMLLLQQCVISLSFLLDTQRMSVYGVLGHVLVA